MKIEIDFKATLWTSVKAHCPICYKTFTGWYCPSCGLPKKNSKYAIYKGCEDSIHNCDKYHFRPEFSQYEDFQLCEKCYSTNPSNAKYCRNCGEKFNSSKGIAKNAHGWIDLGLSVLWATETIEGLYFWNNPSKLSHTTDISDFKKWRDINREKWSYYNKGSENSNEEDVATRIWGEKWRTPTKEEFEELMIKCKWEKCIDPKSNKHALKVIGPNGNSIILPVTGYAGCNETVKQSTLINLLGIKMPDRKSEAMHSVCALWTSSKDTTKPDRAYAFHYTGYKDFTKTLTEKEKKKIEFENERFERKSESLFKGFEEIDNDWWKSGISEKRRLLLEQEKQKWQIEQQKRREEIQILNAMGDDSREKEDNRIKDIERRRNLWLNTPIEMRFNEERLYKNTIRPCAMDSGYAILPVVDKKWKGKL